MSKERIFRPRPTKFSLFTSSSPDGGRDSDIFVRNWNWDEKADRLEIVFTDQDEVRRQFDVFVNENAHRKDAVEAAEDIFKEMSQVWEYSFRELQGIPEIALKLFPFILPRKLREAVAGDLTEDFQTYAAKWGRRYALRWLWWELAGLCVRRFGPTALVTAAVAWLRQKIGL